MKKRELPFFRTDIKAAYPIRLIITGILLFTSINLFAYDFSDIRRTMDNNLAASNTTGLNKRIAIVYYIPDQPNVKKRTNLVKLKKDLSYELLKSFEVVDPIIVQEVIKTNQLNYQQIAGNSSILKQFADRTDSSQVLFIELRLKEDYLQTSMKLVNNRHEEISNIEVQLPLEPDQTDSYQPASYQTARVVSQSSTPQKSVFEAFKMDFIPKSFVAGQNDAWIYFSPTAEIIPDLQSIDISLWLKHLAEVDIRLVRLRYDVRLFDVLQMGIQSNAIVERKDADIPINNSSKDQGHHSTYISAKYQVSDGSSIPISLAIGIRKRLLWDKDNTDFKNSTKSVNDKNDQYNQLTLLLAATGKLESLGLLYNFYLDSQTLGVGAKFLLTSEIKLFADTVIYHHQDPQLDSDTAFGVQLYNPAGAVSLSYQVSTEQTQLGLLFDF
ncbi:hypothetical protein KKI24_00350 [bacterium]|nr:hypothetical protein [bacterium]